MKEEKYPRIVLLEEEDPGSDALRIRRSQLESFTVEDYDFLPTEILEVRTVGHLAEKGFFLSSSYNWKIVIDEEGAVVLVAWKKN